VAKSNAGDQNQLKGLIIHHSDEDELWKLCT